MYRLPLAEILIGPPKGVSRAILGRRVVAQEHEEKGVQALFVGVHE